MNVHSLKNHPVMLLQLFQRLHNQLVILIVGQTGHRDHPPDLAPDNQGKCPSADGKSRIDFQRFILMGSLIDLPDIHGAVSEFFYRVLLSDQPGIVLFPIHEILENQHSICHDPYSDPLFHFPALHLSAVQLQDLHGRVPAVLMGKFLKPQPPFQSSAFRFHNLYLSRHFPAPFSLYFSSVSNLSRFPAHFNESAGYEKKVQNFPIF